MYTTKDKQFITFHLDDGKTVKYDLSTGQTIGKKGKLVKSLNSQLKGYDIVDIIESFENPSYRRFFKTVYNQVNNGTINNMLVGMNSLNQIDIDMRMIEEDGTDKLIQH